ncbi:hypothetical protein LSPCS325_31870 [Lysinibacillus sp. CTST325]
MSSASIETPIGLFMIYTAFIGAGMGFATTTYTVVVQSEVDWKLRGISVASFNNNHDTSLSNSKIQSIKEAIAFGLHKEFLILSVIVIITCFVATQMKQSKSSLEK